jgi:oligopeptide transport system substrate-binding protein
MFKTFNLRIIVPVAGLLLLALVLGAVVDSCNFKAKAEIEQAINLNLGSEPPTLDPRRAYDMNSAIVLKMLCDGLTRIYPNGRTRPSTAENVSVSTDLKKYVFHLRESYWNNGDPVTAHDFEYAWKWVLSPDHPADFAYQLYVLKNGRAAKLGQLPLDQVGVKAVDDRTLVVELEDPTPYFLELTSLLVFYPVNSKVDQHQGDKRDEAQRYISNGPFKMVSWKHENEIILEKSPSYWDAEAVKLERINLLMVPDANTQLNMFNNGELDWAGNPFPVGLPADAIPSLKESGKLHIKPEAATYFFELNTTLSPLSNLHIRKALAYAINRKEIIDNITQANHVAATGILPPTFALQSQPYFNDGDISAAQAEFKLGLKELQLTPEKFPPITLSFNSTENNSRVAQAVQQQIEKALGIKINLKSEEWKVYLENLHMHQFEMARMSWIADFNDPIAFLEAFKYKNNSANNTGWENPQYVELLDKASNESNYKKRSDLLHDAELLLVEQMPIIPVYFLMNSYLKNPLLQNVYLSGLGDIEFKWAFLENE